ncbi:MAG TPA: outer membrane beta-barrel protein [Thermoanaerobaculia bacterium]|nr:outer membrane beta-barrel protein [Thermoanaerobaculia bacterium]
MRKAVLSLASLLALSWPAVARAQSGVEITPTGGYRLSGKLVATDRHGNEEDLDVKVDESSTFGAIVDIPFGESGLALELLANRQESAFVIDPGLLDPQQHLGDVAISYYQVGLLYEWGGGQVRPYAAVAGGFARIDPQFQGLESDDRASASLAFGAKVFFNRNFGLRFEGRGYWIGLDSHFRDDDDDRRFRDSSIHESLYQGEGTAGLIFKF